MDVRLDVRLDVRSPDIRDYVYRLELNKELLLKHPEEKELLQRKIREAKEGIIREAVKMYGKSMN